MKMSTIDPHIDPFVGMFMVNETPLRTPDSVQAGESQGPNDYQRPGGLLRPGCTARSQRVKNLETRTPSVLVLGLNPALQKTMWLEDLNKVGPVTTSLLCRCRYHAQSARL